MTRRMPSVAGEQPIGGLAFQPAPVDAQSLEQLGAEHDITVLASLASADMNDHASAVDIADLQLRHFGATCARGIEGHQQNAMQGKLCRVDQARYSSWLSTCGKCRTFFGYGVSATLQPRFNTCT
jgi:hypothetical protein